jgi:hypothetical protein
VSRGPTANDFAVLGLRPGAGDDEIRTAYRRLAKVHHPDRNPGDAQAIETFRQITESYAALRDAGRRPAPPLSPLSAARAVRRRASPRRGTVPVTTHVADLPVGGALWVDAAALLVAPDRRAALRPNADGSTFPSAERVIRVERRADGHHVFIPPQPSARWRVSGAAETDGLAVAALWVGERQDGAPGPGSGARLPLRLISGCVGEMTAGDRGWTSEDALAAHAGGEWSIDLAQPLSSHPHRSTRLRVLRDADGFRVHSDLPASAWTPQETPSGDGHAPVLAVILAGQHYPLPPAA